MKTMMKTALIVLPALLLSGQAMAQSHEGHVATPPAATGSGCFRTSDIKNHTVAEDGTIYLKVGVNDVYAVTSTNRCARPFDRTNPLVIKTPASTGYVCKAIDLDLGINRNGFTTPCLLKDITKLTPEAAAALPKDVKP